MPAGSHLDPQLRERVQTSSAGNPLFVEEMLALLAESDSRDLVIPPTIQALLAARFDQLRPEERTVLECGSVEGQSFHQGAVQVMAPEEPDVPGWLMALGPEGPGPPRSSCPPRRGRIPVPASANPRRRV